MANFKLLIDGGKFKIVRTIDGKVVSEFNTYRDAFCELYRLVSGDLGGYVASEISLSHAGDARVFGNAEVYGDAFCELYRLVRGE